MVRQKLYNLLRWSEQYTKTDMVYLARGGFWLTLGQAVSTATAFGLAVAFANLLPPETYGVYQFVLATAGVLSATTLAGLNTAAIRAVARQAEGVVIPALKTKLRWGTIGSGLALMLSGYYWFNQNNTLSISFLLVSLFLPFFYSLGISSSLLKGKKLFDKEAQFGISSQIVAGLAVLTTLFFTDNIFVIIAVYFGIWTLIRAIIFRITIKKFKENDDRDERADSYGKHLSLMGAIGTIADNIDKLLIFHFLGAVEVAIYAFAIAPVMQLKGSMKNIHTLALPKLSQRTSEEIRDSVVKKSVTILLFSIPVIILYILAAPYIYKIFFPAYMDSVIFSQVFSLVLLLTAVGTMPASALEAQMEVRKKYLLTSFSKISKIILMVTLIIPYGIWGIVYGIILTSIFTVALAIWLVKKN